jgi:hypothetical protein
MHKCANAVRTITRLHMLLVCNVLLSSLLFSPKEFTHQFLRECYDMEICTGFNTVVVCTSHSNSGFLQSFDARDRVIKVDSYKTPVHHHCANL